MASDIESESSYLLEDHPQIDKDWLWDFRFIERPDMVGTYGMRGRQCTPSGETPWFPLGVML